MNTGPSCREYAEQELPDRQTIKLKVSSKSFPGLRQSNYSTSARVQTSKRTNCPMSDGLDDPVNTTWSSSSTRMSKRRRSPREETWLHGMSLSTCASSSRYLMLRIWMRHRELSSDANGSSILELRVYAYHTVRKDDHIGGICEKVTALLTQGATEGGPISSYLTIMCSPQSL